MTDKNNNSTPLHVSVATKEPIEVAVKAASSVEIKRNSKGNIELIIKVRDDDPTKAANKANQLFSSLNKKHPFKE